MILWGKEGTNERTNKRMHTTTKHITTLLLRSRVKNSCYRPKFSFINDYSRTLRNIILYWNGKLDSLSSWMLPKLPIIPEICSNKSRWELNFVQKSQWAHMSISPKSGASWLERLPFLKYYNVLKWESVVHFLAECCQNYQLYQTVVEIKVVEN